MDAHLDELTWKFQVEMIFEFDHKICSQNLTLQVVQSSIWNFKKKQVCLLYWKDMKL